MTVMTAMVLWGCGAAKAVVPKNGEKSRPRLGSWPYSWLNAYLAQCSDQNEG